MTIEIYSHNALHYLVDITRFEEELKKEIKFNQNVKVFFINNPKIKGLVETDIDLLLLIAIENKTNSYYTIKSKEDNKILYFNNLIIPIKFIDYLEDIIAPEPKGKINYIYTDKYEENIGIYINELSNKTKHYLESIWKDCQLDLSFKDNPIKFKITPHPIIWTLSHNNKYYDFTRPNFIYAPRFGFNELIYYLRNNPPEKTNRFTSNAHWSIEKDNHKAYMIIDDYINLLKKQLENDNKIGLLTKKKIDRLNKQYAEDLKIYEKYLSEQGNIPQENNNIFDFVFGLDNKKQKITILPERIRAEKELNKNLIIISGKAGSGKTFEMLSLIKKSYENAKEKTAYGARSGYYLTYNKLLANDVRTITNHYQSGTKTAVKTIHKFIYQRTMSLLILRIMNTERIKELLEIQDERKNKVVEYISKKPIVNTPDSSWDKGTREFFLRWIGKSKNPSLEDLEKHVYANKIKIENKINREVFLVDYYQVLRYLILAIQNPRELFYKLKINSLTEKRWEELLALKEAKNKYKQTPEDFTKLVNRSLGSVRGQGKILFIDEGQDCHPLERDLFLLLWGKKNIVVCTGGKEQLIRHSEECNWKYLDTEKRVVHNVIEIQKRNRTFRMKQNIVDFCNFIANEFQINLDLSAIRSNEDKGTVLIEMNDPIHTKLKSTVDTLKKIGIDNELSNYESILFLMESDSKCLFEEGKKVEDIQIDSNNNVLESESTKDKISNLSQLVGIPEENLFLHNQEKKNQQIHENNIQEDSFHVEEFPSADTYRGIFYESCRGLEAWSVVCLDLDLFFDRKKQEETAASYLSDDLYFTEEERKQKYAATWVLMVLTRPIDTLYIHINNPASELGKLMQKYIDQK